MIFSRTLLFTCLTTLFSPFLTMAEQAASSMQSSEVSYDGNALVLSGGVHLEHALGTLASGFAKLDEREKEGLFSHVLLHDNVLITLKNQAKLACETAELNFQTLKGILTPKSGEKIRFDSLATHHLSMEALQASLELVKEGSSFKVAKIDASQGICASYLGDFLLQADRAIFTEKKYPHLLAYSNCLLSHLGDRITADSLEIFPSSSQMLLLKPKGALRSLSMVPELFFSSQKMTFLESSQELFLEGDIQLESLLGTWQCDEEIYMKGEKTGGKWLIQSVSSRGKTKLTYESPSSLDHFLICHKSVTLDQDKMTIKLESPSNAPLEYCHGDMFLIADQGQIDYGYNSSLALEPLKLFLTGHICLSSGKQDKGERYATADNFTYFPKEKKIVLSSSQESPVLFWDSLQDLSISAKEVHIFHTPQGDRIQGVGNVKLTFSSSEHSLLNKLFPFYKKEGEK